jgi:hypothetical protein
MTTPSLGIETDTETEILRKGSALFFFLSFMLFSWNTPVRVSSLLNLPIDLL